MTVEAQKGSTADLEQETTTAEPKVGVQNLSEAQTRTPGLKKIAPYWYAYTTMAKERWMGREILEMVSTEFRDRSMEYYRFALESGVTTINGKVAKPDTVIRNGDRIENVVHRHEPPVTSTPVKVLLHDKEREFIVVDKPGSIPVHPAGRFHKHSLLVILQEEFGYGKVYPINRLDRLTSGLMIIPLSSDCARQLTDEFMVNTVKKIYVARCSGKFPDEEIIVDQPLLTVDRQMGLNIVHPEGKTAKTIFNIIHYDPISDSSVVRCQPVTGRSHQIRVHLQYLGHPVANDPLYSEKKIWGDNLGKGGIDVVPSDERSAPAPPAHLAQSITEGGSPEALTKDVKAVRAALAAASLADAGGSKAENESSAPPLPVKLLPRETGHDIGMGSPVPLSAEAVRVITNLRNMKDEDEDWSRWRDVVFRAKKTLVPVGVTNQRPLPPSHRRERGGPTDGKKKQKGKNNQPKKGKKAVQSEVVVGEASLGAVDDAGLASSDVLVDVEKNVADAPPLADAPISKEHPPATSVDGAELETTGAPQLSQSEALAKAETFTAAVSSISQPITNFLSSSSLPTADATAIPVAASSAPAASTPSTVSASDSASTPASTSTPPSSQADAAEPVVNPNAEEDASSALYCPECYLPLHPDPKPEKLYIFLHALKYTTSMGTYETEMPEWTAPDFVWDKS